MEDAYKPDSPKAVKPVPIKGLLVVLITICICAFWFFQETQWHNLDNLPKEYQEVIATPFDKVNVSDYWNSSIGHGTKFSFLIHSTIPIEVKNESLYEKIKVQEKNRYPWASTALHLEKQSGDITILLDSSRRTGHVHVHTPSVWSLTRDGKRLYKLANFSWPNELTQIDEDWKKGWAQRDEEKGFQFCNMGPESSLISVTHIMDPRNFPPEKFERQIRQYLSELEGYNPENEPEKVTEKLLQVHVPDSSFSEDQLRALSKIAAELSTNYGEPFDGKTWRIRSRNGKVPIRLKIFVAIHIPQGLE